MARAGMLRALLAVLAIVIGVTVLRSGALQAQLLHVAETFSRLRPESVFLVLLLTALSTLISGGMWCKVLSRMGYKVPVSAGLSAYASTGLASYLMNTAGAAVGGIVCLRHHGVCAGRAVIVTLIANALGLCGILAWAPIGLLLVARPDMRRSLPLLGSHDLAAAVWMFAGLGVCMVVSLWALISAGTSGGHLARRLLRRPVDDGETLADHPPLRVRHILAIVPWSALSWLTGTLSLYVLLVALSPDTNIHLADVVGASVVAGAIGSLAFFVPSGVGVRDGALITLLAHASGVDVATCTAAALTLRALDPFSKFALLLLVASRLPDRLSLQCRRASALLAIAAHPGRDWPVGISLARLSARLSDPIRAVVRIDDR